MRGPWVFTSRRDHALTKRLLRVGPRARNACTSSHRWAGDHGTTALDRIKCCRGASGRVGVQVLAVLHHALDVPRMCADQQPCSTWTSWATEGTVDTLSSAAIIFLRLEATRSFISSTRFVLTCWRAVSCRTGQTTDLFRRSATSLDKTLKGNNPTELPVEQPTKFEFVINLRTAEALGLTIPRSVLTESPEIVQ